ncbi:MAG: FAD-dependent urate hydroxylase [Mycobacterium sp.]|jgi:FAD-dependent urate hydroxylase|nr:FAD-dependent urate hydroxylase [Mycobacterium sp.]
MDRHLRILVVGAGVGGISAARGLLRDGHDVTVFERRPELTVGGGAVTIWSNGATVLGQLGVDLTGAGQVLSTLRVLTSTGHLLATFDLTAMANRLGAPIRMIPRRVLLERLLEDFPSERIRCDSRVVGVVSTDGKVRVDFADGSTAAGDLVIGADGLHSAIRPLVTPAEALPTGWCSWQGLVTLPDIADTNVAVNIIGRHGNLGLWPAGGAELQWWFDLPWSADDARPARPIDVIRAHFTGWSDAVDRVLASLGDDDLAPSPYPHFRHPIPRLVRHDAVTLLGDAAHTMPPFLAQGTNQALLDTMVLCEALSELGTDMDGAGTDVSHALRSYENRRRRRVGAVSWLASRQVSQREFVLRPAATIPDRLANSALTTFQRAVSHRWMCARISRDLAVASPARSARRS